MYDAVQKCTHCGANLSLDDMRRTDCPYCRTVYPHHSQAQQHAQVIGQVMGQMMGQQAAIQNQWRGAFGAPPIQPGPPGGPPPGMAPPGAGPYGPQSPYGQSPFGYDPNQMMQAHMDRAAKMSRSIGLIIGISFALVGILVAVVVLLAP